MLTKQDRKGLFKAFEARVLAGESKSAIYGQYPEEGDARLVARVLAQIPTASRRQRVRHLNWVLLALLCLLAMIKLFVVAITVLAEIPKAFVLILFAPVINLFIIWLVAKYRAVGYILLIGFGFTGISKVLEAVQKSGEPFDVAVNSASLACIVASMALAAVIIRKMLPQTTFLLFPKKDAKGEPVFEE
jgi:hypothetical protein